MNYILLIILSVIVTLLSKYFKKDNKKIVVVYIVLASLLAASRPLTIQDTGSYITVFNNLTSNVALEFSRTYMEKGFILFSIILKSIFGPNFRIYFFVIALTNLLLILKATANFYKHYRNDQEEINYVYPLVVYLLTYGFAFNYITLRAGLAFSFLILALSYLKMNKLKTLIFYLISITFHNSSIIYLAIVPFLLISKNNRRFFINSMLLILVPSLIFGQRNLLVNVIIKFLNEIPFLYSRFHAYINPSIIVDQSGSIIRLLLLILMAFLLSQSKRNDKLYEFLLFHFIFGLVVQSLLMNIAIIGRISEIFLSVIFLVVSFDVDTIRLNFSLRRLLINLCLIYFIISNFRLIS